MRRRSGRVGGEAEIVPARGIRFRPPHVANTPEISWMLSRAFAAPSTTRPLPIAVPEAMRLMTLHNLEPRVGTRLGWRQLREELGDEAATHLQRSRLVAEISAQHLVAFARKLAERAASAGTPVVFLKFAALTFGGTVMLGARWASDVDLLAPRERAEELWRALVAEGMRVVEGPPMEHQLSPLVDGTGAMVEVHRCLYGVRSRPAGPFMTVEDMQTAGLLTQVEGVPGASFVPTRVPLLAHLLVHGIAQHGFAPASYPMLRVVGDLIDLGFERADDRLVAGVHALISDDVSHEEVLAVRELCRALAAGEAVLGSSAGAPAALLLGHALAGAEDHTYQRSLKVASLLSFPTAEPRPAAVARAVFHTLFLGRAQVDAIYGPPKRPSGYVWRRVWRPMDLAMRLVRYVGDGLMMRVRRYTDPKT